MRYVLLAVVGSVAVVVFAAVALAITLIGSEESGTAQVQLDGVSLEELAEVGIHLSEPEGEAVLAAPQAAETATASVPPYGENVVAKETVLVHLIHDGGLGAEPLYDTLAYAVNMEPATVMMQRDSGPIGVDIDFSQLCPVPRYYVSFVNAYTGAWLFSQLASTPPDDCPVELGNFGFGPEPSVEVD